MCSSAPPSSCAGRSRSTSTTAGVTCSSLPTSGHRGFIPTWCSVPSWQGRKSGPMPRLAGAQYCLMVRTVYEFYPDCLVYGRLLRPQHPCPQWSSWQNWQHSYWPASRRLPSSRLGLRRFMHPWRRVVRRQGHLPQLPRVGSTP